MRLWSEDKIPCGEAKLNSMCASFLLLLVTKENQLLKRRLVDSIALGSVPGSGMAWLNEQLGGKCVVQKSCPTSREVPTGRQRKVLQSPISLCSILPQ